MLPAQQIWSCTSRTLCSPAEFCVAPIQRRKHIIQLRFRPAHAGDLTCVMPCEQDCSALHEGRAVPLRPSFRASSFLRTHFLAKLLLDLMLLICVDMCFTLGVKTHPRSEQFPEPTPRHLAGYQRRKACLDSEGGTS